jgi:exopolysaccharide production protein ExoZ
MIVARAQTDRNAGLDLLRALAIVLTFLVHFLWVLGGWQYARNFERLAISDGKSVGEALLIWLYHSQHGVFLFFVLSGFLMGKKWFSDSPPKLFDYLRDRAWRTLPGAWLAITAALALMAAGGQLPSDAFAKWFENLFFLNWFRKADTHHLLVVTWSLHAEWLFYLVLPCVAWLAIRSRYFANVPRWICVAVVTLAICVVLKFVSVRGAAYALFFGAGVITAIAQSRLRATVAALPWWLVLALYSGVNLAYSWFSSTAATMQTQLWNAFDTHSVAFAFAAALLLLKAADAILPDAWWVRAGRYIGKISYSIYLWHLLVILAVGQWLGWPASLAKFSPWLAITIYSVAVIALTWIASALSFKLIEQPYFTRRARQQTAPSR